MHDFLDQIAQRIAVARTANPLARVAFEDWQPLVTLVAACLLMAIIIMLPSILEALARGLRDIRAWVGLAVRRSHAPPSVGVRDGGWLDIRRHGNHPTK